MLSSQVQVQQQDTHFWHSNFRVARFLTFELRREDISDIRVTCHLSSSFSDIRTCGWPDFWHLNFAERKKNLTSEHDIEQQLFWHSNFWVARFLTFEVVSWPISVIWTIVRGDLWHLELRLDVGRELIQCINKNINKMNKLRGQEGPSSDIRKKVSTFSDIRTWRAFFFLTFELVVPYYFWHWNINSDFGNWMIEQVVEQWQKNDRKVRNGRSCTNQHSRWQKSGSQKVRRKISVIRTKISDIWTSKFLSFVFLTFELRPIFFLTFEVDSI